MAEATIQAADSDIEAIDRKIELLLKERASRTVIRSRLEKRVRSLVEQAAAEAAGFQAYRAEHERKGVALLERKRQAEVGLSAAEALRLGLAGLAESMRGEMAALRVKAHELQLDVAADLAAAYSLGHSSDYLLSYYEQEHKEAIEAELASETGKYKLAVRQSLVDRAQELKDKIDELKAKLDASNGKIAAYQQNTARLDAAVATPWAFLCANALGGGPAAAGAGRIVVRTSEANRDAWDGEDRELERPEGWNEEMRAEADREKALLLTDGAAGR